VPSLDLRFADNKSLVDAVTGASLVTITRASSGTVTDSAGTLQTAATDVPRFDHDPTTGESLGLLVEEQRTNGIRNNTMVGAVAGTPGTLPTNWAISGLGTLTQQVVGVGTAAGISYIDIRLSGTTSNTSLSIRLETNTGAAATNGQTFTHSFWSAVVGGSTFGVALGTNANLYDSGGVFVGGVGFTGATVNTASTLLRTSGTGTIATANTAFIQPQLFATYANGAAIDITIRIGLPQLEQGAFATSPIPTTTAAATRSADVASITGSAFSSWYNATAMTIFSEASSASGAAYNGYVYTIGPDFNNSITHIRQSDFQPVARIRTAAVDEYGAIGNGAIWTGTLANRFALALSATSGRQASNGALAAGGDDTSIAFPAASSMTIGTLGVGALFLNGTIRRICFWPTRLSNASLQAITQ
jgi:hypothetical protein